MRSPLVRGKKTYELDFACSKWCQWQHAQGWVGHARFQMFQRSFHDFSHYPRAYIVHCGESVAVRIQVLYICKLLADSSVYARAACPSESGLDRHTRRAPLLNRSRTRGYLRLTRRSVDRAPQAPLTPLCPSGYARSVGFAAKLSSQVMRWDN
jgi:hypothetical protein